MESNEREALMTIISDPGTTSSPSTISLYFFISWLGLADWWQFRHPLFQRAGNWELGRYGLLQTPGRSVWN